jgi:hypothetical protein
VAETGSMVENLRTAGRSAAIESSSHSLPGVSAVIIGTY